MANNVTGDFQFSVEDDAESWQNLLYQRPPIEEFLTKCIVRAGLKSINEGVPPAEMMVGVNKAVEAAAEHINKLSKSPQRTDIRRIVINISPEHPDVADVISKALETGKGITLETAFGQEPKLELADVLRIEAGLVTPAYAARNVKWVREQPYVLISRRPVTTLAPILRLLAKVAEERRALLILAPVVEGEALQLLKAPTVAAVRDVAVVCYPDSLAGLPEDIALVTGAKVIPKGPEMALDDAVLGIAQRVIADGRSTTIVPEPGRFTLALHRLRGAKKTAFGERRRNLELRLHRFRKAAIVTLGSFEQLTAAERALLGVRAAFEQGAVPVLGSTSRSAGRKIIEKLELTKAERAGAEAVQKALVEIEQVAPKPKKDAIEPASHAIKTLRRAASNAGIQFASHVLPSSAVPYALTRYTDVVGIGGSGLGGGEGFVEDWGEGGPPPPVRVAPLHASHWFEDKDEHVLPMDTELASDSVYWCAFEIAPEKRSGATVVLFTQAPELEQAEQTVVFLEVTCELLKDKFERRRARYVRGKGLAAEYFELKSRPGKFDLQLQIICANRPVYNQTWRVRVMGAGSTAASEAEPEIEEQVLGRIEQQAQGSLNLMPSSARSYRLRFYSETCELVPPDMDSFTGKGPQSELGLIMESASARKLLKEFAEEHSKTVQLDRTVVGNFLSEMARWGRDRYDQMFSDRNKNVRDALEQVPAAAIMGIATSFPSFPWEWVYMSVPPRNLSFLNDDKEYAELLSGFWGLRFEIDILPTENFSRMELRERLPNPKKTIVLAALNQTAYGAIAQQNLQFVEGLPAKFKPPSVDSKAYCGKAKTIEMLQRAVDESSETPHVLYFYCHHSPGKLLNEHGFLNDKESQLIMLGKDEDLISVHDLKYDVQLKPFSCDHTPLIILNACATAQGQDFSPSGFIPYFTGKLRASSVLATLAEIPALHGYNFASEFIDAWLKGVHAAGVLRRLRMDWLLKQHNPFPMFYTLHGNGYLGLERPLTQI